MRGAFIKSILFVVISAALAVPAFAQPQPPPRGPITEKDKTDAQAVNSACASDAKAANCGGEVVGRGLLRCLEAYKRAQRASNKGFELSSECESARKQLWSDRKSGH